MGEKNGRFKVSGEITFAASHHLRTYRGSAEEPHEHEYRLKVTLSTKGLDEDGISFDFVFFDAILDELASEFDGGDLNEHAWFADKNPSAEHIAVAAADYVNGRLPQESGARVTRVEVWELSHMSAIYYPPD